MPSPPSTPNPRDARKSLWSCAIATTLIFALAVWQLLLMPGFIIPVLDSFDSGVEIPWIMARFITLPSNGVFLFALYVITALITKELVISRKRLTRRINLAAVFFALLYFGFFTFAVITTLAKLTPSSI